MKIKITKNHLQKLLNNNKTQKEIAQIFGCSDSLISQKVKKFGLKTNKNDKYIGKKYGSITVLKYLDKDKNSHRIYECVCDCGQPLNMLINSLTSNNTKTCGCKSRKRGKEHLLYSGYEEIRSEYWSRVLRGAKERNIRVEISIKDAWEIFLKQNRRCALTGQVLHFPYTRKTTKYSTASLDRIDSSIGYTKENTQWIHKKLQPMKMNMKEDEFIDLCKQVYLYNKE